MERSMRRQPMGGLDGCRILLVEDEYFLADDLKNELNSRGAKIVGPIADLSEAEDQVCRDGFDVAVIDVKLGDEFAWSIADKLMRDNIPFVFVTGYGAAAIPDRFREIKRWEKPYDMSKLTDSIRLLCSISKTPH